MVLARLAIVRGFDQFVEAEQLREKPPVRGPHCAGRGTTTAGVAVHMFVRELELLLPALDAIEHGEEVMCDRDGLTMREVGVPSHDGLDVGRRDFEHGVQQFVDGVQEVEHHGAQVEAGHRLLQSTAVIHGAAEVLVAVQFRDDRAFRSAARIPVFEDLVDRAQYLAGLVLIQGPTFVQTDDPRGVHLRAPWEPIPHLFARTTEISQRFYPFLCLRHAGTMSEVVGSSLVVSLFHWGCSPCAPDRSLLSAILSHQVRGGNLESRRSRVTGIPACRNAFPCAGDGGNLEPPTD